jgi:drug/metabolite transporter (DMT)-like permease
MEPLQSLTTDEKSFWVNRREEILSVSAILAAVLFWGCSFAAMRVAVNDISPLSVMWCRMIVALALLLPFYRRLVPKTYRTGDWKLLVPMVFCQPCLYFLLESYALQLTTSSQAGVIAASVPLIVGLGAWLFLSETLSRSTIVGLMLSVAGVVCLTLMQGQKGSAQNPLLGNSMEVLAMACAAANMLMVKKLSDRYNPWTLTGMQVAAGCVFFIPGLPLLFKTPPGTWRPDLIGALVFLGAFVTLGAFGLYNWGMSRIPASRASIFINLVPVVAVFSGWVLLGEGLTGPQLVAASGVIAGVTWSQVGPR